MKVQTDKRRWQSCRILLPVFLCAAACLCGYAKELKIDGFEARALDITASTERRSDLNGNACALIKMPHDDQISKVTFEGNIIDMRDDGSEVWAWFSPGTKKIVLKSPGFAVREIVFSDYGIYRLMSKTTYILQVSVVNNGGSAVQTAPAPTGPSIFEMIDDSQGGDPVDEIVANANAAFTKGKEVEAVRLLKKAVAVGHPEALLSLGMLYEKGIVKGKDVVLNKDERQAFALVQQAAQQGYVPAQRVLSRYYLTGVGVDPNKETGDMWKILYDKNIKEEVPAGPDSGNEDEVFQAVELMPEYPGGNTVLMRDIANNINYPVIAAENNIQGRIVLEFIVNKDGSISDIRVVRSLYPQYPETGFPPYPHPRQSDESESDYNLKVQQYEARMRKIVSAMEEAAISAVSKLKKFYPGKMNGVPVRVHFTVPINFRLM